MEHNENCECCRCVQIPQKPYEECCNDYSYSRPVERYNPCVYHNYCQTPCNTCGRTHFQQSTSVIGILPVEYEILPDMSHYSQRRVSDFSSKSARSAGIHQHHWPHSVSQKQMPTTGKSMLKRNGLDDVSVLSPKNIQLQTCKDTGVGDCPACFGTRTNCHQNECQLCCEVNVCGPKYQNCPFNPGAECQTELAQICSLTGVACRCTDSACNTSKHCILVDTNELDTCLYTAAKCRCATKECEVKKACAVMEEERHPSTFAGYHESYVHTNERGRPPYESYIHTNERGRPSYESYIHTNERGRPPYGSMNPDDIRRCHNLCQTTIQRPGKDIDSDDELDEEDSELGLLSPITEEAPDLQQPDTVISEVKGKPRRPSLQKTPQQPYPVPVTNQSTHTISRKASQTPSQPKPSPIAVATQADQNIGQPDQATEHNQDTNVPQTLGQPAMTNQIGPTSSATPNEIPGTSTVNPHMSVVGAEEKIGAPVHHSGSSRRQIAFDDALDQQLPTINKLAAVNADVNNILNPEDNQYFEVIIEEIPLDNGETRSRITIKSCASIDMKSPSQNKFCIDASKAQQMPMVMELTPSEEDLESNVSKLVQTAQTLTPVPSLQIQEKPTNIPSAGAVLKKEKSQVHFDIGITDDANDRIIVLTHENDGCLSRTSIITTPKR